MKLKLECSILFKNDNGDAVELRSLEGKKGFLIELIYTNVAGNVTKDFSEHTPCPIPEGKIYAAVLLQVSTLLKQQYKILDSSIPLAFPEISFDDISLPLIAQTKAEASNYEVLASTGGYVAQAVTVGEPVRLYITASNKHFVCMNDRFGKVMPIPCILLSTLASWFVNGGVCNAILEGYLTHRGELSLTDILYNNGSLTQLSTLARFKILSKVSLPKGCISLAPFGTSKQEFDQLRQACFDSGKSIILSGNTNFSEETKKIIIDFKEEAQLMVMAIDYNKYEVKLCATISNVPIELGRAPIPKKMELHPLDCVSIKYGKVDAGQLVHVEIMTKLDTTEQIPLDPVLTYKLGFNIRPTEVNSKNNESPRHIGILSALDAVHE